MDPSVRLDYVLFQLTPTRTRCDLVIFAGKSNEKLAYGLLEPFIAHLRSAKDQISKGGYSVTLRPPSSVIAPWFTKATLQRFVRFVSTPEVLERFVTIEREIAQLENSIKSYEASNADGGLGAETEGNGSAVGGKNSAASFKSNSDNGDHTQQENSKVRLQRVVETRKAVLRKEQAMVYARALAAGFEMDNLDGLLFFADAFGASRLREACLNFKDLCKKKNEDRLWVDEIAAMQAIVQPDLSYLGTSGIILAEDNDPTQNFMMGGKQNGSTDVSLSESVTSHGSSDANQDNGTTQPADAKAQIPNAWPNQFPPYMRNFGPVYQQMPPYQGYVYPGMQVPPPYYPPNMQWPPNSDRESHDRRRHKKPSRKKDKVSNLEENAEIDGSSESSGSSSETETDSSSERSHKKKHGKKASRKVVIRNINYISSKRDGEKNGSEMDSSDEDDYLDGNSLKKQLEDAVGSFEKHQKSSSRHQRKRNGSKHHQDDEDVSLKNKGNKGNENWDALQQLLLKEDSDSNNGPQSQRVQAEEEYFATERSEEQKSNLSKPEAENLNQRPAASDAFLVSEMGPGHDDSTAKLSVENFDPSESFRPATKRSGTPEEFMFSQRTEEPDSYTRVTLSDDAAHSVVRSQTSDDWFVGKKTNDSANGGENNHLSLVDGVYVTSSADQVEKKRKDAIIDDSLMIQGRLTDESQMRSNISLVSDFVEASLFENGMEEVPQKKSESLGFYEPDDLYMVLDRDTAMEHPVPSWTPEMDYENNVPVNNAVKEPSDKDVNADSILTSKDKGPDNKKRGSATKASAKDARSRTLGGPLRKGKPDTTPANRRSTFGGKATTPKSLLEKKQEEERRKRMEELLIQRQKRIAERSATTGGNTVASKKPQAGSKATTEKSNIQSSAVAKKPKTILRTSTIERLAAAKTVPQAPTPPKKAASKVNSASQKETRKLNTNKTAEKKSGDEKIKGISSSVSDVKEAECTQRNDALVHASEEVGDSVDIKELHVTSSVINKDVKGVSPMVTSDEKVGDALEDHSTNLDTVEDNHGEKSIEFVPPPEGDKFSDDHGKKGPELSIHPLPESPTKSFGSTLIIEEKDCANMNVLGSPEISEIEDSTPPLTTEMNLDPVQSRKKWDSAENSPKATKGFRKLLMFGRKS